MLVLVEYLIMQFWHVRKIYMHIHIHTYISISYVTGIFSALVYITVNVSWFISDVAFPDGIAGGYLFLGNMVYTVSCYWLYSDIVIDKSWCNTLMMTPWCCDTFVSYHHGMVGVTPWWCLLITEDMEIQAFLADHKTEVIEALC